MNKKGKQFRIDHSEFKITYGTVNKEWTSCFMLLQSWVLPKEEEDYENLIKRLRKKTKTVLESSLDLEITKPQYIIDLDLRLSGMSSKKRSFMSVEVILYPKERSDITSKEYLDYITNISNKVIGEIKNESLECYLQKT